MRRITTDQFLLKMALKTLYHGTCVENLGSIKQYGLLPQAGAFVSEMYGLDYAEEDLPELVFAADKSRLKAAVTAMYVAVARSLGKGVMGMHDLSPLDIRSHGAIVVVKGEPGGGEPPEGWEHRPADREEYTWEMVNHTRNLHTVEPGDYYSEDQQPFSFVLTGPALIRFLYRNGFWTDAEKVQALKGMGGRQ
jgi:hypothetical protein